MMLQLETAIDIMLLNAKVVKNNEEFEVCAILHIMLLTLK